MAAATVSKSVAQMRAEKNDREAKEQEKSAKSNGRAEIDAAHKALGTPPDVVPGIEPNMDDGPQDVHEGDAPAQSASGAPTQLGFQVGGKKPTAAQVRIVGGKIDVPGNYLKGQSVEFRVIVRFGEVAFVDLEDKETGQIIGCDRRQKGRITSISQV